MTMLDLIFNAFSKDCRLVVNLSRILGFIGLSLTKQIKNLE